MIFASICLPVIIDKEYKPENSARAHKAHALFVQFSKKKISSKMKGKIPINFILKQPALRIK